MKKFLIILSCVLLAAVIAIGTFWGWQHYQDTTYIYINDVRYLRAETQLDMSDQKEADLLAICQMEQLQRLDMRGTEISAEDYQTLRAALPGCNILWEIPFQGSFYDEKTSHLTVTELNEADIDALAYFTNLREVDATDCTDYQAIFAAKERYPDCRISYQVTVSGQEYTEATTSLTIADPDTRELELALVWLPKLTEVHLTGVLPEPGWLMETAEKYPEKTISWEYMLFNRIFDQDVTEIDLSEIKMEDTETVEAALPYFPKLEKVVMCNCGIPSEEMDALNKRYDDVRFVWSIRVGRCELRTDATVFMPFKWGYTPKYPLYNDAFGELKYCTDLICMDLGHMQVSDISFLNYMPNMQYLLLADTLVTDLTPIGNLTELIYLELFVTNFRDLAPLANCKKLEDINLCWTYFKNIGVLIDMPNLKHVWLIGSTYSQTEFQELVETHPNTEFCTLVGGSSTGFGWRETENYRKQRDMLDMGYMHG